MDFKKLIEAEVRREERCLKRWEEKLASAPEGSLSIRRRKDRSSYYWNYKEGHGAGKHAVQKNITANKHLIIKLVEKRLAAKLFYRCKTNLACLRRLEKSYESIEVDDALSQLPESYREVMKLREKKIIETRLKQPYKKAPFNALAHTHETDYGELVRSKSEQLIANALYAYGIPFHYEEVFDYQKGVGSVIYPDFTILLPDGGVIIWEHLGLLSDLDYCQRTAEKLNIYQKNGYTIGKNLILTMDDNNQNISSILINQIIETQILPHFTNGTQQVTIAKRSAASM